MRLRFEAEHRPEESDAQQLVYKKTASPGLGWPLTALGLLILGLAAYLVIRIILMPGVVEDGVETVHLEFFDVEELLVPFLCLFLGSPMVGIGLVLLNEHELVIDKASDQVRDETNLLGWHKVTERRISEFDSVSVERTERRSGSGPNETERTVHVVNLSSKQGNPPLKLFEKSDSGDAYGLAQQVGDFLGLERN